jgi:anti-sigma B factor antagonist
VLDQGSCSQEVVEPAVITLAAEIDLETSEQVTEELTSAIAPGVDTIIADLTATTFCDSSGVRALLLAHQKAAAAGVDLWLAMPPGPVLRIITLLGVDEVLPIFPSLDVALAAKART